MKKIITAIATLCIASSVSLTAYAAENLDRDYIESEIWEEMWLGKNDDGTEYPEASYKHHILDKWLDENYGSDDYDWSEIGELKYSYKDYYNDLISEWDFNDDRNGNWTIDTEDNSYRFQLINNQWNMIDKNGDTVEIFPIFSTLDEEEKPNQTPADNDKGNGNNAVGIAGNGMDKPSESLDNADGKVSAETSTSTVESVSEPSESNALPLVIGGAALVGIVIGGVILYKRRK